MQRRRCELRPLRQRTPVLDPPQIAEMRRVLRRYATDGRAVLVSSHLLAEVEQTCTHVVVVHQGEIVASGPVSDVVGDSPTVQIDVNDLDGAEAALRPLGLSSVAREGSGATPCPERRSAILNGPLNSPASASSLHRCRTR